ncbi:hypothetical protein RN001_015195 [Aquatica leii]|uniref:Peptidase S1 domain-containing protein n=1 Tax=Aquatica leii TaxID=1421715 RepID=A0AAN7S6J5_9COLE|nr:hypothetical protein RN001_015195 [Aquatica leii]
MNLFFIFAFATCAFAHSIGRTLPKDKIVGGSVASKGQFPYQISERYNSGHVCGGSIIDQYTILTAAHCVDGFDSGRLDIVVGSNQLSSGGVWYSVSRYIIHEQWNSVVATDDIAVIKVLGPIKFTTYIQPIVVGNTFTQGGAECVLSGFGITSYPGTPSNDLLYFKGKIVDLNRCQEILQGGNFPVLDSNICAFSKNGVGACSGDSGGPLVTRAIGESLFQEKILGGNIAFEGQFPHQISQRYYNSHNCGGSIIDRNTILTAAHCINRTPVEYATIVAGTNKLKEGGETYSVLRIIVHESWNPIRFTDDIAVIKVTNPIEYTIYIQPIALNDKPTRANTKCTLSGWGLTSYPGTNSNDLKYYTGKVINLRICAIVNARDFPVLESNICIFAAKGVGACKSDSGGPLISNNKQVGILSWGFPCALGVPDVFTRVSYYIDWIHTQQNITN